MVHLEPFSFVETKNCRLKTDIVEVSKTFPNLTYSKLNQRSKFKLICRSDFGNQTQPDGNFF